MKKYFLPIVAVAGLLAVAGVFLSHQSDSEESTKVVSRVYQHQAIPAKVTVLYDSADEVEVDFEQRFGRLLQALEWRVATGSTVVAVAQAEPCRVLVATGRSSKTVVVSFLGGGCQIQGPNGLVGQVSGTDELNMLEFIPMLQRLQKPVVRVPKGYS